MTFLIGFLSRSSWREEWNEKMECLNEKYNLDYYSSSESDSDFEPEHKYAYINKLVISFSTKNQKLSLKHVNL